MRRSVPLLALLLSACLAVAADNLYPDPGFEQSGRPGDTHSGQRAGYLAIGERQHWVTIGGRFDVEPYATYLATAWAKATFREGSALALYVYQWDSYVWAFSRNAAIANGGGWQQVSIVFRVPQNHIFLHPLAFMDAAHGEAWIDDIVVERVKSAADTISELQHKTSLADDDARLLARWYVAHGDRAGAEEVLSKAAAPGVKADIACVLGLATQEPGQRAGYLAQMIASGAAGLNDGPRRIAEVARGIPPEAVLSALGGLLKQPASRPAVAKALAAYCRQLLPPANGIDSLEARAERLGSLAKHIDQFLAALGDGDKAELTSVRADVAARQAALEKEMQQRGNCLVTIGGTPVNADTYVIVRPDEPTPSEDLAARDLQAHLEKITGQVLPVVTGVPPAGKLAIVVGRSPLIGALGVSVDYDQLGDEGLRIATAYHNLVLTGNQRGVLYAVYVFLEEHLGCRWFTPDCATWPTSGRIEVGDLDLTQIPVLEYRATDYPNARPPEFAVRNRLNGAQVNADAAWGGHITYRGFVHTFNSLVPPEQYFATHPEYFSMIGGKRIRDYSQLCLTNPDVLKVATATVRRWIAESPAPNIVSVSQNDWHNPCDCPTCHKLAEAEGSQSGPLLHFVNAIADDIASDYPDVIIDTLAYQYTRKPPLHVRPHANVAVRLCSIECEFNRPLDTSPFNATFTRDIQGWNAICNRLHIWDYVINYAHTIMPFPNLRVLKPNIRFFVRNGVKGIYEEADYYTKGGELAELRTYLMAKCLWNPDYDVELGIDEFLPAYYGAAAAPVRRYLDEVHKLAVSDRHYHMPIYVGPTGPHLAPAALDRYDQWFDQAEAAVKDDPVLLHRVQVARMPILYTRIARGTRPVYKLGGNALSPTGAGDVGPLVDRFEAIARAEGVSHISEGRSFDDWLGSVARGAREIPLVKLAGGGLTALVAPRLGGRIYSLKRGEQELLQVVETKDGLDPTTGGYKEFSESGYQSPGWTEPYEVVTQSETAVTLRSARLRNGLVFERSYALLPDQPVLRVTSKLTNASGGAKTARIRVHACFHLADAAQALLRVGAGEQKLASGASREAELWFRDADRPAGLWTIVDPAAGVSVANKFRPEQVEIAYFNWNGPDHRANPELWSPERSLRAGESLALEHEYAIGRP